MKYIILGIVLGNIDRLLQLTPSSNKVWATLKCVYILKTRGKIPAIKEYRRLTGEGLRESKQHLEYWARENN